MYLPALDWDAVVMGKTIALKLNKKEEQFITQINSKGITNSELLRAALRQYVQSSEEFCLEETPLKNIFVKQENIPEDFLEMVSQVKTEVQLLQNQVENLQKQMDNDVRTLKKQVFFLTMNTSMRYQDVSSVKQAIVSDVHQQIDDFLSQQSQKNDEK
jgi:uncharacterized protein YeeX (DUF496 family)